MVVLLIVPKPSAMTPSLSAAGAIREAWCGLAKPQGRSPLASRAHRLEAAGLPGKRHSERVLRCTGSAKRQGSKSPLSSPGHALDMDSQPVTDDSTGPLDKKKKTGVWTNYISHSVVLKLCE